ncbi:MAG: UDP-2,3-diacylglucosamine diphosphatase LpxI [Nitrospira sp.]|nr:UDP-2,3-diacylglucosamine diphosphatase LpxI [bacterium]MBL7048811.1 UDP-2,3-diacylglucosamine diphosphatase LpxI [Nitrospira sp.]
MPLEAKRSSKTLAVIAGQGSLPAAIASEAKEAGYYVIGIALQPVADESLRPLTDEFHKVNIGRLGSLISLLGKLSVKDAVMAGKVSKELLYKNKTSMIPDMKAIKLIMSLKDRKDDTIMNAFVGELEKAGVILHKTTSFTKGLLAPEGPITNTWVSDSQMQDINFGWDIAREMGRLDIGQTVVVKNQAVMAIEAIEGTDECIVRGGKLAVSDAVVIKVSKPQQDMRFDVPVVGADTLQSMKSVSASLLAIEAGKCIIIDKNNFIKEAEKFGITVFGVSTTRPANKD